MIEDLKGDSLADVLEKLERGKIGHRGDGMAQRQELRRAGRDHAHERAADARTPTDAGCPGNARLGAPDFPVGPTPQIRERPMASVYPEMLSAAPPLCVSCDLCASRRRFANLRGLKQCLWRMAEQARSSRGLRPVRPFPQHRARIRSVSCPAGDICNLHRQTDRRSYCRQNLFVATGSDDVCLQVTL
jgi:hypothetical protein